MMLNNLLIAQQKGKDEENLIIFVLFLGSYESLCVIFLHALKFMEGNFVRNFLQKRFLYIVYSPFNFSSPYFPKI